MHLVVLLFLLPVDYDCPAASQAPVACTAPSGWNPLYCTILILHRYCKDFWFAKYLLDEMAST